jgi:hypothetical protein
MGYKFSLVLSREVSDEESAILQEAGCVSAVFGTDSLPTNAQVTVTKMDFDDTVSPSLAEAIESAFTAVKKVPDLSVPGLTVPAQSAQAPAAEGVAAASKPGVVAGTVVTEEPAATGTAANGNGTAAKKPTAKQKPAAKKPAAKKTEAKVKEPAEAGAAAE